MKNLKRFLSGALATVMVAAMLVTGASAKSFDDVTSDEPYAEQIEILTDIGVIKGTSENEFSPDEKVTREQMALLLFRLMIGKESAGTVNSSSFTDLYDPTYSGAISWANASGYIIGTSATTFEPTRGISLQDAMTMLVRALGHSSIQMNGGYPWTYIDAAIKLGLDENLEKLSYTKELTRAEIAAILYNALTAEYLIPRTAPNGMTFYESTTIIERVFGYELDESVLVATNDFAIEGVDRVTKDGFVTLHTDSGLITVKYADLELSGEAEDHIGKTFRLAYKIDEKSKLVKVLGCTEIGKAVPAEKITMGKDDAHVEIGGVKYQVVETLSDALSTNANEILVFAFGTDGTLAQVTTNSELSALIGAFDATLIFDNKASTEADRLIIKPFAFGKHTISGGKVTLAGGMKEADVTVVNPDGAKNGDHVLYYFNSTHKTLEIATVLPVTEAGKITRMTATTVTIGGKTYTIGNEKLGVSAESLRAQMSVGDTVHAVVFGDQVLAIEETAVSIGAASKYLVATSTTTPIFTDGKFGYVFEALIDGVPATVFTKTRDVVAGTVYRYTVDDDGIYTIIAKKVESGSIVSGNGEFVQSNSKNDEIAFVIDSANGTTVEKRPAFYRVTAGSADSMTSTGNDESFINFITGKDTVIVVISDGEVKLHKGALTSAVTVNDGASVTAIFDNQPGAVEALRFMYISDGSIGQGITTETSVKVLEATGVEYVDGTVLYTYKALDIKTGKISEMYSTSRSLSVGTNYRTDSEGLITATEASIPAGVVNGYTGSTITIGEATHSIDANTKMFALGTDGTVSEITIFDAYMSKVEFITEDGKVIAMLRIGGAEFRAEAAAAVITVTAVDTIDASSTFTVTSLTKQGDTETAIDITEATVTPTGGAGFGFTVTLQSAPEAGDYEIAFTVNGVQFTAEFTVA